MHPVAAKVCRRFSLWLLMRTITNYKKGGKAEEEDEESDDDDFDPDEQSDEDVPPEEYDVEGEEGEEMIGSGDEIGESEGAKEIREVIINCELIIIFVIYSLPFFFIFFIGNLAGSGGIGCLSTKPSSGSRVFQKNDCEDEDYAG